MTNTIEKKLTRASFKSFVNKNRENLYFRMNSRFDGMTDCIQTAEKKEFVKTVEADENKYNLGVNGVWLVGSGRDYFSEFDNEEYTGFFVSNCCGSFILATKK